MFYDPNKTYEDNFDFGPFFDSVPILKRQGDPGFNFLGFPIYLPFGIAAGPLPTSKHVKAAFDWGYDVVTYKTQRSVAFGVNEFPNVVPIVASGEVSLEQAQQGVVVADHFPKDLEELVITNSFGNPSRGPEFWVDDMKKAIASAGAGQVMVASVVGTIQDGFSEDDYFQDFAETAKLAVSAGAQIVEINLSCPNVANEGVLCYDKSSVARIVELTKLAIGNTPLLVKFGYYALDQQGLLEDIVERISPYVAGIVTINTIPAKVTKLDGSQALPGPGRLISGLCGAGIRWAGTDMVERLADLRDQAGYDYQVIGVGGVMTPSDYHQYREIGADLVQACTGPMWRAELARDISESKVAI